VARAGKDVILLDADLRRPQVVSRFHIHGSAGLGGVLVGEAGLEEAFVEPELEMPEGGRLRVLPAGPTPPNPSELLASQRMKVLLEQLTGMSDLVIVDSTPILTVSDSLPLVELVSGVVAVARLNSTSKDAVKRFEKVISNAGGTLLGSVATGASAAGLYGAYGYGYGYYAEPQDPSSNGDSPVTERSGFLKSRRQRRRARRAEADPARAVQAETVHSGATGPNGASRPTERARPRGDRGRLS
jgi:capsular exopolysaccharide synthesis family protein